MSLEQAILTHAEAINSLAAAILKVGEVGADITTTIKVDTSAIASAKPEKAAADKADTKKESTAAKPAAVTGKPGADPKAKDDASSNSSPSVDYSTIRTKILELTKQDEGRDRCAALLARFGCVKGPDLKETQWEEFDADIDKVLSGKMDPRSAIETEEADDGMA